MTKDFLATAELARRHAFEELEQSRVFAAFLGFNDVVVALGGSRQILGNEDPGNKRAQLPLKVISSASARVARKKRAQSHADVARAVLEEQNGPLTLVDLMKAVVRKGIKIGGKNPTNNFRSTISRDAQFQCRKINGSYMWWINGKDLPESLADAAGGDLLTMPATSSLSTSLKGGEANATSTH